MAKPKPLSEYPDAMTVKELASFLRVGERTVYEMLLQQKMPHIRIGRQYRIPRAVVEQWMAGGDIATTA